LHNDELNLFNSRSKPRNKKTTRRWLFVYMVEAAGQWLLNFHSGLDYSFIWYCYQMESVC